MPGPSPLPSPTFWARVIQRGFEETVETTDKPALADMTANNVSPAVPGSLGYEASFSVSRCEGEDTHSSETVTPRGSQNQKVAELEWKARLPPDPASLPCQRQPVSRISWLNVISGKKH